MPVSEVRHKQLPAKPTPAAEPGKARTEPEAEAEVPKAMKHFSATTTDTEGEAGRGGELGTAVTCRHFTAFWAPEQQRQLEVGGGAGGGRCGCLD